MHLARGDQDKLIRSCSEDGIGVGSERYNGSLIVTNESVSAWPVASIEALSAERFDELLEFRPEIILIGTGRTQHFPSPEQYARLLTSGVGVEFMTTPAACRTFNIVLSEGREVMAALIAL